MIILVTGVAGFIGSNLARELLKKGETIVGIDNLNDYYDVNLKLFRLEDLNKFSNFTFIKCDIADKPENDFFRYFQESMHNCMCE